MSWYLHYMLIHPKCQPMCDYRMRIGDCLFEISPKRGDHYSGLYSFSDIKVFLHPAKCSPVLAKSDTMFADA